MRPPNESRIHVNGIGLALYEWPASAADTPGEAPPTAFFAHATGFHARCWDRVVEQLPGVRCLAIDMRGHGRSDKPAPPYPWRNFADDVAATARHLGLRDAVAVGHSKGGYAVTLAAALAPGTFGKLLLIDPVILSPEAYASGAERQPPAVRRRNRWTSAEEMFERFSGRPPFDTWDADVLHDYCNFGLLPAADGDGFVLACPPEIEAATYAGAGLGGEIYEAIAALQIPVHVLRARGPAASAREGDMRGSPTAPDLASRFAAGEDHYLPQYSHFLPMEDPAFVAARVREML